MTKVTRLATLGNDLFRGSRLIGLALFVAVPVVVLMAWRNPGATLDELATTGAVPVIISYLLIRAIMWFVSGLPQPAKEEAASHAETGYRTEPNTLAMVLGWFFVVGFSCVVSLGLSLAAFWLLGLGIAVTATFSVLRLAVALVSVAAVLLCLKWLCRPWLLRIAAFAGNLINRPAARHPLQWVRR